MQRVFNDVQKVGGLAVEVARDPVEPDFLVFFEVVPDAVERFDQVSSEVGGIRFRRENRSGGD